MNDSGNTRLFAAIIEVLLGWMGFLGVGHIILGFSEQRRSSIKLGVALLLGWWVLGLLSAGCAIFTLGLGMLCLLPAAPIYLLIPVLSGFAIVKPESSVGRFLQDIEARFGT